MRTFSTLRLRDIIEILLNQRLLKIYALILLSISMKESISKNDKEQVVAGTTNHFRKSMLGTILDP
jgi:hypothetical protein